MVTSYHFVAHLSCRPHLSRNWPPNPFHHSQPWTDNLSWIDRWSHLSYSRQSCTHAYQKMRGRLEGHLYFTSGMRNNTMDLLYYNYFWQGHSEAKTVQISELDFDFFFKILSVSGVCPFLKSGLLLLPGPCNCSCHLAVVLNAPHKESCTHNGFIVVTLVSVYWYQGQLHN